MEKFKQLTHLLAKLPLTLASLSLFSLMILTFCDVILRSLFNSPIEAATEMTRLMMAVIVFSVLPIISARGEHISVDLLDHLFKHPIVIRIKSGIISLTCGIVLIWPAERIYVLAERARSYGDLTEYLHIPQFYIAWFIAIMTFITALVLIGRGILELVAPQLIKIEEAHTTHD